VQGKFETSFKPEIELHHDKCIEIHENRLVCIGLNDQSNLTYHVTWMVAGMQIIQRVYRHLPDNIVEVMACYNNDYYWLRFIVELQEAELKSSTKVTCPKIIDLIQT